MPDVSIYVALITGGVALAPQLLIWRQNQSQAKLARREQFEMEARLACKALHDATVDVETEVWKNSEYHGAEMAARLARVREPVATARKAANDIAFLMPREIADAARKLADAADDMLASAEKNMGIPDFAELKARRADFSEKAVVYLMG